MEQETKIERRLARWIRHATRPRGAAIVIGVVATTISVIAGFLMTVLNHDEFPSVGSGLWWAVQTVTTVGYGDHVPADAVGRLVATVVMLLGIGLITVITASITSGFVAQWQQERSPAAGDAPSAEQLKSIDERLERIEAALKERP